VCVCRVSSGDMCVYVGFLKEMCIHLEKHEIQGHTTNQEFLGFAGIVYSFLYFSLWAIFLGTRALVSFEVI
jgi:hypothetical protein